MKIKTITCQHVYNYGATLQAYALQRYLEELNHKVEIIRFIPWYFSRYNFWSVNHISSYYEIINKFPILKIPYCFMHNTNQLRFRGRKKSFDNFDNSYLHLTPQLYDSSDSLKLNPPDADLYIAGSDQIWNTDVWNGKEDAYYLNFGDNNVYRASYAASFGIEKISNDCKQMIKERLASFDKISVRETTGVKILNDLEIHTVKQVIDPVFLLSRSSWHSLSLCAKQYNTKGRYILLYNFIDENSIKRFSLFASERLNLPIISITDFSKISYANKNINDAGPLEFISLIENADLIIGNSFHATAFSILFHKEFYVFPLAKQNNSSRMIDFLKSLDLLDRFMPTELSKTAIDYDDIDNILSYYIGESKDFLDVVLDEANVKQKRC